MFDTLQFTDYVNKNLPKSTVWAVSFKKFGLQAWFEVLTPHWRQKKSDLFSNGLCYLGQDGFIHMFFSWGSKMVQHGDGTSHFSFDHAPATMDVMMMSTDTAKQFYQLESEYDLGLFLGRHFVNTLK